MWKQHLLKSINQINIGSTEDISFWHPAPFWQGSDLFTAPVPLWSRSKLSLPCQAARWLWRRRTTNTLLPSAGQHKETLLDLKAESLLSLTAWDFKLRTLCALLAWDWQQRGKNRGLLYGCCFFRVGAQEGVVVWWEERYLGLLWLVC